MTVTLSLTTTDTNIIFFLFDTFFTNFIRLFEGVGKLKIGKVLKSRIDITF